MEWTVRVYLSAGEPTRSKTHDDQALVRAMAQIARAFGKKTVAAHVESGEVLELLAQFDIDYAQGYYTGAPVPMTVVFPALTDACTPFPERLAI